jgi:hypothetical protein
MNVPHEWIKMKYKHSVSGWWLSVTAGNCKHFFQLCLISDIVWSKSDLWCTVIYVATIPSPRVKLKSLPLAYGTYRLSRNVVYTITVLHSVKSQKRLDLLSISLGRAHYPQVEVFPLVSTCCYQHTDCIQGTTACSKILTHTHTQNRVI